MKAALKFIMTAIGLLLIAVNIGTIILLTRYEGVLRDGLAKRAGAILQADIHLEAVRFDWARQALVFKGVSIFNPEGFSDREAMRVEAMRVYPNWMTIFSKEPELSRIYLEQPELHLQYKAGTGTNLGAMMEHARHWGELQAEGDKRVWGRPLHLRELQSDPLKLHVKCTLPPTPEVSLAVDAFTVKNPGGDEAVSGARVMHVVLKTVMKRLASINTIVQPVRELLLGESDVEAA